MSKIEPTLPYQKVAIVMMSAIGDAVHVLPVVNALKRTNPHLHLTWVIQPVPHRLVYNHPAVDQFIICKRGRGLKGLLVTARQLRGQQFDLVIALQVYMKAGMLTAAARSPMKLGFDRARARDLNWLFTTHRIPPHPIQHVQDQYFEFLEYLGIDPNPVEWGIAITAEEEEARRHFLEKIERPVCSLVVGASKREKSWAADRYARLSEIIESDFGFQLALVGGASRVERETAAEILRLSRARIRNELGDDLRRLIYLLDGSDVVISPDTGPLHIARALQVPVVGLYGYTNPKRSGPYRKFEDLVADGYARYPGEAYPASMKWRPDGMSRISVEMVAEKFELATRTYMADQTSDIQVNASH